MTDESVAASPPFRILAGMFLLSCASLMYELSLSRLLAISLWHHYAFVIISAALLGYGSAGSFRFFWARPLPVFIPPLVFALGLVPSYILANKLPFDPALMAHDPWHGGWLLLHFMLSAVPFFLAGLTLNLLLERYTGHSFLLYCWDLTGAAAGCLVFFWIAPLFLELEWLLISALFTGASAVCLAHSKKTFGFALVGVSYVLAVWFIWGVPPLQINAYKSLPQALRYPGSYIQDTFRDAATRVDLLKTPLARFAPGLSLEFTGKLPEQAGITIDGDGLSGFSAWNEENLGEYLRFLPAWGLYAGQAPPEKILVLQSIGGQEVLGALEAGSASVTVQTEYPLLAAELSKRNQYEKISIYPQQSRAFLSTVNELFDRILISIESTVPAGSTGMDPLRKDYLATREGMGALLERLTPSGWLALHRYLLPPPRAEIRMLATLLDAMRQRGWDPEDHLGVFRTLNTLMVFASKKPWTADDVGRFRIFCDKMGYSPVYFPGMRKTEMNRRIRLPEPVYAQAVEKLLKQHKPDFSDSPFKLNPLDDDRPYFYLFLDWTKLKQSYDSLGGKWEGMVEAGMLVPLLLAAVILFSVFFIAPPLLVNYRKLRLQIPGLLYFFVVGLAFMLAEIALMEKLTPFLGRPVHSLAIVLGGLLLSSGAGSFLSRKSSQSTLLIFNVFLLLALLSYFVFLPELLSVLSSHSPDYRWAAALMLVFFPGTLMGIPFPAGMKRIAMHGYLEEEHRSRVALTWCSNGCASVIGATLAIFLAQTLGQSILFLFASVCYAAAVALLRRV